MSEKITKITSDGGVTKKILKEGEGAVPAPGSTVGGRIIDIKMYSNINT